MVRSDVTQRGKGEWGPQSAARPATGFMLSDEEMLVRLGHLYGNPKRIRSLRTMWAEMRVPALTRGAFVGRGLAFGTDSAARLAARFPRPSFRSLKWLAQAVDWPRRKSA